MTNHAWPCDQEGEISQGHFSWHSLIGEDGLPLMMTTVVLFDWRRTVQYFLTVSAFCLDSTGSHIDVLVLP